MSRRVRRLLFAACIGLLVAVYADLFWTPSRPRPNPSDFAQSRVAARMLLEGRNPYNLIGPGREFDFEFPHPYPITSAVVAIPFSWPPPRVADPLFVGCGAALLAWVLTRKTFANPQLLVFASFAMMVTAQNIQWSPWLTAAALTPWLGFLFACKPTMGLAMLAAYPSRAAVIGCGAFALLTVAIWPWWIQAWLPTLSALPHMSAPVTRWGGPLILLSLLKWRRSDARLLAALACVPQTPVLYEAVPLFLLVQTFREGTLLVVLMGVMGKIVEATEMAATGGVYNAWMAYNGQWMVWMVYLPCTVLVLRRPNEGLELDWLSKWTQKWTARGQVTPCALPPVDRSARPFSPR